MFSLFTPLYFASYQLFLNNLVIFDHLAWYTLTNTHSFLLFSNRSIWSQYMAQPSIFDFIASSHSNWFSTKMNFISIDSPLSDLVIPWKKSMKNYWPEGHSKSIMRCVTSVMIIENYFLMIWSLLSYGFDSEPRWISYQSIASQQT